MSCDAIKKQVLATGLKVVPDPYGIQVSDHPAHKFRMVGTADCVMNDEEPYECLSGHVIATLTDCEGQEEYARMFAAAPKMLQTLKNIVALHAACNNMGKCICAVCQMARTAIKQSEGE